MHHGVTRAGTAMSISNLNHVTAVVSVLLGAADGACACTLSRAANRVREFRVRQER